MSDDLCGNVRRRLIDSKEERGKIPPEILEHLASCAECRDLGVLLVSLSGTETTRKGKSSGLMHSNYHAVDLAFETAALIEKKRGDRAQFISFALVALSIAGSLPIIGAIGYGIAVLAVQAVAFMVLPFVGLIALRKKLKGVFA